MLFTLTVCKKSSLTYFIFTIKAKPTTDSENETKLNRENKKVSHEFLHTVGFKLELRLLFKTVPVACG